MTILDASLIFFGMFFFQEFWQLNFKLEATKFPPEFIKYAIPLYIMIWLFSNHFSGGNDKPYNIGKMIRGVLVGTILISAFSNFFDNFRYSKAVILFGGLLSTITLITTRVISHFIRYKNFELGNVPDKNIVLIGDEQESKRVIDLLKNLSLSINVIGFINPIISICCIVQIH